MHPITRGSPAVASYQYISGRSSVKKMILDTACLALKPKTAGEICS